MSLQLQEGDFNEETNFKYALLAHEFFHVYQIYLSNGFDQGVFWLIEGQAATVESLYLKEFMNDSGYIMNFLNKDIIITYYPTRISSDYLIRCRFFIFCLGSF